MKKKIKKKIKSKYVQQIKAMYKKITKAHKITKNLMKTDNIK